MRAFPHSFERVPNHPGFAESEGMDLRDYFAAKVLSGIYSIELGQPNFKTIAEDAYKQADAMMKAREEL